MLEELDKNKRSEIIKALKITRMALSLWIQDGIPWGRIYDVSRITGLSESSLLIDTYTKRYGNRGLKIKG